MLAAAVPLVYYTINMRKSQEKSRRKKFPPGGLEKNIAAVYIK